MDWWLIQLCFNISFVVFLLITLLYVRRNMPGRPYFRKNLQLLENKIGVLEDLFGKTEKQIKKQVYYWIKKKKFKTMGSSS